MDPQLSNDVLTKVASIEVLGLGGPERKMT